MLLSEEPDVVEHGIPVDLEPHVRKHPLHTVRLVLGGEGERKVDYRSPVVGAFIERSPSSVRPPAPLAVVLMLVDSYRDERCPFLPIRLATICFSRPSFLQSVDPQVLA